MQKHLLILTFLLSFGGIDVHGQESTKDAIRETRLVIANPTQADWDAIEEPTSVAVMQLTDFFDNKGAIEDSALENLIKFSNLRTLILRCPRISDDGLKHVAKLKELEALLIYESQISDRGIQQLNALPRLKTVGFWESNVTAKGLELLKATLKEAYLETVSYGDNKTAQLFDQNGCVSTKFIDEHFRLRNQPKQISIQSAREKPETEYSGTVLLAGVGDLALPPGTWTVEYTHSPTGRERGPNIYVLKRKGNRLERLTFMQFGPDIKGHIRNYIDGIGGGLTRGIPSDLVNYEMDHDLCEMIGETSVIREVDKEAVCIGVTYVHTGEKLDPWMSHSFVCECNGGVLVCIHASPFALSPQTVQDIYWGAEFESARAKSDD